MRQVRGGWSLITIVVPPLLDQQLPSSVCVSWLKSFRQRLKAA